MGSACQGAAGPGRRPDLPLPAPDRQLGARSPAEQPHLFLPVVHQALAAGGRLPRRLRDAERERLQIGGRQLPQVGPRHAVTGRQLHRDRGSGLQLCLGVRRHLRGTRGRLRRAPAGLLRAARHLGSDQGRDGRAPGRGREGATAAPAHQRPAESAAGPEGHPPRGAGRAGQGGARDGRTPAHPSGSILAPALGWSPRRRETHRWLSWEADERPARPLVGRGREGGGGAGGGASGLSLPAWPYAPAGAGEGGGARGGAERPAQDVIPCHAWTKRGSRERCPETRRARRVPEGGEELPRPAAGEPCPPSPRQPSQKRRPSGWLLTCFPGLWLRLC